MVQSIANSGLQPTEEKNSPVVDYYLTTIFLEAFSPQVNTRP